MKSVHIIVIVAWCLALAACSKGNDSSVTLNSLGKHPDNWLAIHGAEFTAQHDACSGCHGSALDGGITGVRCLNCHGSIPSAVDRCGSCHSSQTQSPTGSHAKHVALVGCEACHNGAGSGSAIHLDPLRLHTALLSFQSAYNAKSGTASYNAGSRTCANVKCHGGQTTPAWGGTLLQDNTYCYKCHSFGRSQFNSYSSGKHYYNAGTFFVHTEIDPINANFGIALCVDCHDMGKATTPNHFSNLSSSTFNLAPAKTIRAFVNYSSANPSCSVPSNTAGLTQTGVCHFNQTRRQW